MRDAELDVDSTCPLCIGSMEEHYSWCDLWSEEQLYDEEESLL